MTFHIEAIEGIPTAVLEDEGAIINIAADASDLLAAVKFEQNCGRALLRRTHFHPDFFILSTGLLGEVLQKFSNYRFQVAIRGDFTGYTSEPLQAFIRESNRVAGTVTFIQENE